MRNNMYIDKKGCIWHKIMLDSKDNKWMYAVKAYDENGDKTYNWKPKRVKIEWFELIEID